jgi:hypothetical protein
MQGTEYITDEDYLKTCIQDWLDAKDNAIKSAKELNSGFAIPYEENENKVTKQLCNRLLEPFMYTTMLISGNVSEFGWLNFFDLRCPKYTTPVMVEGFYAKSWNDLIKNHMDKDNLKLLEDNKDNTLFKLQHNKGMAEIHMMALAESIYYAWKESKPKLLKDGEWHIPFDVNIDDVDDNSDSLMRVKIATAACARTSYTVVGNEKEFTYDKQLELHDRLITSGHYSPLEHCAKAMNHVEYYDRFYRKESGIFDGGWCRHAKGFIPYRYMVESGLQ